MAKSRKDRIVLIRHDRWEGYVVPLPEEATAVLPEHNLRRKYSPCRIFAPDPDSPIWSPSEINIRGYPFPIITSMEYPGNDKGFLRSHMRHVQGVHPWTAKTIDTCVRESGQRVEDFNGLLVAEHAQYRAGDVVHTYNLSGAVTGEEYAHNFVFLMSLAVPIQVPEKRI
ncbi:hypothetical protein HZB90_03705 [archaeon]|nr:hypothetical protein [archaeon]